MTDLSRLRSWLSFNSFATISISRDDLSRANPSRDQTHLWKLFKRLRRQYWNYNDDFSSQTTRRAIWYSRTMTSVRLNFLLIVIFYISAHCLCQLTIVDFVFQKPAPQLDFVFMAITPFLVFFSCRRPHRQTPSVFLRTTTPIDLCKMKPSTEQCKVFLSLWILKFLFVRRFQSFSCCFRSCVSCCNYRNLFYLYKIFFRLLDLWIMGIGFDCGVYLWSHCFCTCCCYMYLVQLSIILIIFIIWWILFFW